MAFSDGWFGMFTTQLADEFGTDAVRKMSIRLSLTPMKMEQINDAKNSGLELLSVLEELDEIGEEKGIGDFCVALRDCSLHKIARKAEKSFKELNSKPKPSPGKDITDGPMKIMVDLGKLKTTLNDQLTAQHCLELAVFFGLPPNVVQERKTSEDCACVLIQMLHDGGIISESNIDTLLFALKTRGMIRVLNLIQNSDVLKSPVSITESSKEFVIPNCFCGESSFDELLSESDKSSVISLRCMKCSSEWIPKTETTGDMSVIWKDINYSYKIPFELDLLKLKHETINSISELKRGDHIIFDRAGLYHHHAIYLGDNGGKLDVIHWTTKSGVFTKGNAVSIKRENKSFPGKGLKRVNYDKQDDDTKVVIARAFKMLKNSGKEAYSVLENNCESLASYCKIGKSFSTQGNVLTDNLPPNMLKFINFFGRS